LAAERFSEIRKSGRGGSIYGGEYETSLMLYLGEPVDMDQAIDEDIMRYHSDFIAGDNFVGGQKVFWSTWGLQKSKTGIYGDPTVATAETGRQLLEAMVANGVAFAREFMSV
jgi:creatinine amidohydrolase